MKIKLNPLDIAKLIEDDPSVSVIDHMASWFGESIQQPVTIGRTAWICQPNKRAWGAWRLLIVSELYEVQEFKTLGSMRRWMNRYVKHREIMGRKF